MARTIKYRPELLLYILYSISTTCVFVFVFFLSQPSSYDAVNRPQTLAMSAIARLLRIPASCRTYSSYFSSKAGGGRYFNSTKKSPTVALKKNSNVDPSEAQKDGVQSDPASQNAGTSQNPIADAQPSQTASGSTSADESPKTITPQTNAFAEFSNNNLISQLFITPKDFKTHQFFSLHRPLLLISNPSSIFRPVPPNHSIFDALQPLTTSQNPLGFDPASEPSIDADAEAARQLTRALTMNKAGATVSWEDTLKYLGLDVAQEADRVNLQQQFDKDWQEVMMDSTKRKRRKKMKKHK